MLLRLADIAQSVEHVIGNDEVISSNLIISSTFRAVECNIDSPEFLFVNSRYEFFKTS